MRWIDRIIREIFGLFVDDGSLALAVLAWLGVMYLLFLPQTGLSRFGMAHRYASSPSGHPLKLFGWYLLTKGVVLFAGLAILLAESVLRFARKAARKSVPV